jgi:hypothetical protein
LCWGADPGVLGLLGVLGVEPEPEGVPVLPPLLEPGDMPEPLLPEPPEITSMRCTVPEDERLARTWSPSLMSESDAVRPSFITWVESLTLSWSDSWFLDWSILSTLPVTWLLVELEAVPEPIEPELLEPEDPIDEPELEEPDDPLPSEPEEPLDFDGSDDELPDEPLDPDPIDEPLEPEDPPVVDCAPAGSAMSRPAIPRPAIIPLLIFIVSSLPIVPLPTTRHPAVARLVSAPIR